MSSTLSIPNPTRFANVDTGRLLSRSGLLASRHIKGSYTSENLAGILFKIICNIGILNRVSSASLVCRILTQVFYPKVGLITTENASKNSTVMEL